MGMKLPRELIGWHGIGDTKILKVVKKDDGYHVTLDLSCWVDEKGYGESASGFWVKKVFPTTVLLLENPRLDKRNYTWYADRILIGRGRSRLNKYYAVFFTKPRENVKLMATFPHKVRETKRKYGVYLDIENLTLEEALNLRRFLIE